MVVDTSAFLAILLDEPDRAAFSAAIAAAPRRLVSAATVVEAGIVLNGAVAIHGGLDVDLLLQEARIEIVPVDAAQAATARRAFERYGKGRHAAGLNFGDCFAYALAYERDEPLLFKAPISR